MPDVISRAQSAGPLSKRARYLQLRGALWSERATFDSHWREIGDFLKPTRTRFWSSQRNQGGKRNQNIIDSSATFAHRTLQSGMHAGLTSPARPWYKLTTPDKSLAEFKPVKEWLHVVTERSLAILASSNIYQILPIVYGDMGGWGTAAMAVLDDAKDLFRAQQFPIGSYALAMDSRGMVSTFVRDYELTVEQIVELFGVRPGYRDIDWTNISDTVKNLWDAGSYQAAVEVCWIVQPNRGARYGSPFAKDFPFASCHFEKGSDKQQGEIDGFLKESGFEVMPIMAPRWDITGEDTYGTDCPGMTVLGDIKQLQGQQRSKAKAIQKKIDPPMTGSPELRTQKTSIISGDITYVRDGQHGFKAAHEVNLDLSHMTADIQDVRYLIQRGFYEDLFLMIAQSSYGQQGGQPITAREVDERHEEKLLALGPVVERTDVELLDPIIDRVYLMMERAGLIPDAPPELEGVKLKVEYTSIMAQAQKLTGVVGLDRFVASIAPLVEADPSLLMRLDGDQILEDYQDLLGVDPRVLRTKEEATALRQQAAEAQQAQQNAEVMANLARAAKDGSQARMGGDSALDRAVGGAAQIAQQ